MLKISPFLPFFFASIIIFTSSQTLLQAEALRNFMFTDEITGIMEPIRPTKLGFSRNFHLPVDTYEIGMVKTKVQLLPAGFPKTEVLAYASKVNGQWKPQIPGPFILALSDTPVYVIWTNDIEGKHFLPVDYSAPFEMLIPFKNEIPTVPHLHGLETEMGSDGEPMAFWTKEGKKAEVFYSLNSSSLKKNQAIYRYYNTKEGLYWYHDHTMAMTRLNVYAGLAGLYEIINPRISSEEQNILRIYGNVERKHLAISDKSFNQDGSLNYPSEALSSEFTSWVPGFGGNTILVNGKVWPKLTVQPKIYRFVFLNACQGRYLNIYFENADGSRVEFEIFRKDSDFLKNSLKVTEFLLLNGGRYEIFVDFSKVKGSVILRNDAVFPYPIGGPPDEFVAQIMKIEIKSTSNNLRTSSLAESSILSSNTFISTINSKTSFYENNAVDPSIDFIDEPQSSQFFIPKTTPIAESSAADAAATAKEFINSLQNQNRPRANILFPNVTAFTQNAAQTAAVAIRGSFRSSIGNVKEDYETRISVAEFLKDLRSNPMFGSNYFNSWQPIKNLNITNVPYPRFSEGKHFYTNLITSANTAGDLTGLLMDGIPIHLGCGTAYFRQGEIIDFYIVNTMPTNHPIHIHLANFQIVSRFEFNTTAYLAEWNRVNGVIPPRGYTRTPKELDPRPFRTSSVLPPKDHEKLFMDVIEAPPGQVTLARFRIANHNGNNFPFKVSGMRYVWHCHILEHEDNEMMRYFCIE